MGRVCRGLQLSLERRPGVEVTHPPRTGEGLRDVPVVRRRIRVRAYRVDVIPAVPVSNCFFSLGELLSDVQQAWVGGTDVGIERVPADPDMDFF